MVLPHHPIFDEFDLHPPARDGQWDVNQIGARYNSSYDVNVGGVPVLTDSPRTEIPPVAEEYFEWIDVLESVVAARDRYVMAELGAGFGRWMVTAAAALRQRRPQMPFTLIGAEPEPSHFEWLRQNLEDNGINADEQILVSAPVSDRGRQVEFGVGDPSGWYGQQIVRFGRLRRRIPVARARYSRPTTRLWTVTLAELLETVDRVDLIDSDIQGTEGRVFPAAMNLLNDKVKRVHIETHSADVELRLRAAFSAHGWRSVWDFPMHETIETTYGRVWFQGGIQGWLNPRLA